MSKFPATIGKSESGLWMMNVPPGQIHSVELESIYGNNINEQLTKKLSFHFKTIKKLTIRCSVIEGTELCKFISQLFK